MDALNVKRTLGTWPRARRVSRVAALVAMLLPAVLVGCDRAAPDAPNAVEQAGARYANRHNEGAADGNERNDPPRLLDNSPDTNEDGDRGTVNETDAGANAADADNAPPPTEPPAVSEAEYQQLAEACASEFVTALHYNDTAAILDLLAVGLMREALGDQFEMYSDPVALGRFYSQASPLTPTDFDDTLRPGVHIFEAANWDAFAAYSYERLGRTGRLELKLYFDRDARRYRVCNLGDAMFVNRDGAKPVFRGEWIYWVPNDIYAQKASDADWIPAEGEYIERQQRKVARND